MSKEVLVTDSLFVYPEHEALLAKNGYSVFRLDKPKATEAELCDAIKGKVGYILGGVESVTARVVDAADTLKVIAFTGSGFSEFIPGHATATAKGIAITAAVGGNANSVAEYTLALILMMTRRIPLLSVRGGSSFLVGDEFQDLTVGVVGYGHIGRAVAAKCVSLGFKVVATSRTRATGSDGSVQMLPLVELAAIADVLTIHVDKPNGGNVVDAKIVQTMKTGAILINAAFPHAVAEKAMFARIASKEMFAAFDAPVDNLPTALPPGYFIQSNAQTAFNSRRANQAISDMAVTSLLNVLATGKDKYLVNPTYRTAGKK